MPDGSFLVPNTGSIKRVRPDGISVRFAGDYPPCPPCYPDGNIHGEGGPATSATVGNVGPLALGPDGSVFAGSEAGGIERIVRIWPNGILTRVAGMSGGTLAADGRPVQGTSLDRIEALTVGPDGSVYFVQRNDTWRVYRIGPDSVIHTFAGRGSWGSAGDEQPARQAQLAGVTSLAFGPDGSLYIGQYDAGSTSTFNNRVRRVTPDGVIHLVAGGGSYGADGTPAKDRALFKVQSLAVSPEGTVSIGDHNIVYQVTLDGLIHYVAGDYTTQAFVGDKGPSLKAGMSTVAGLAYMADGSLLILDLDHHRVRKMAAPMPGFGGGAYLVASEDGREFYSFSAGGKHLATLNAKTGIVTFAFSYDAQGLLVGLRDRTGALLTIERDVSGAPTAIVAPGGQRTSLATDASGNLAGLSSGPGNSTGLTFGRDGLLLATSDAEQRSLFAATYDSTGRALTSFDVTSGGVAISSTDGQLQSSAILTGSSGTLQSIVYQQLPSAVRQTTTTIFPGATVTETVNPDGSTSVLFPDGTRRTTSRLSDARLSMEAPTLVESITLPSGLTKQVSTRRGYEGEDPTNIFDVFARTDSSVVNGRVTTTRTDRSESTVKHISPSGREVNLEYNGQGQSDLLNIPGRVNVSRQFDEQGRPSAVIVGGRRTDYSFDEANRVTSVTGPDGSKEAFRYDAAGRVSRRTKMDGTYDDFEYDASGHLSSFTPSGQAATRVRHNAAAQVTSIQLPTADSTPLFAYRYDSTARLTEIARADGSTTRIDYATAAPDFVVASSQGDTTRYAYNRQTLNLTSASYNKGASLSYTHDGPLTTSVTWSGPAQGTLSYKYDSDFRLAEERVNGGNSVALAYDPDGLLVQSGELLMGRDRQNGALISLSVRNAVSNLTYDTYGSLDSIATAVNGSPIYSAKYNTDVLGRIVAKKEQLFGTTTTLSFAYDSSGRLSSVQRDGVLAEAYEYDARGNRIAATTGLGRLVGVLDSLNRLLSYGNATYDYGRMGELTSTISGTDTTRYAYSPFGQLTQVRLPNGTLIGYMLDAEGRRVARFINGVRDREWLYRGSLRIAAELDGSGNIVSRFVYGLRRNVPEYMIRSDTVYRLVLDERGSVLAVIDASTGAVAQQLSYDSFGRVVTNSNPGFQPFAYGGGLYDPITGLVHFGSREYDATTGRWTTIDPELFAGGDANLYRYADADPINITDVQGEADTNPEELLAMKAELDKLEVSAEAAVWEQRMEIMARLCHGATGMSVAFDVLAHIPGFDRHHFLQDADMVVRGSKAYKRGMALAMPVVRGIAGMPHSLASEVQRQLRGQVPPVLIMITALKVIGCNDEDIAIIVAEVEAWADENNIDINTVK
jgi:RHS repeat-associated protein